MLSFWQYNMCCQKNLPGPDFHSCFMKNWFQTSSIGLGLKHLVRVSALVRFFEGGGKLKTPSAIFPSLHGSKKHELNWSYFEFKTPKCISLSCKIFCDKEIIRMTSWHLFTLANFECSVQFAVFRRVLRLFSGGRGTR